MTTIPGLALATLVAVAPGLALHGPSAPGAAGARQRSASPVEVVSADGFRLHAVHHGAPTTGPGLLLLHACNRRGEPTGYESLAPELAQRGFQVLVLDSRGFGRSRDDAYRDYRDDPDRFDLRTDDDVQAAYEALGALPGVDPETTGIVAQSCSAWKAIRHAATRPVIDALVFISGTYLDLPDVVEAYQQLRDRPVLAIYAENDRYRTPESMRDAFARSRHPASRLLVAKGDAHAAALLQSDPVLQHAIVDWMAARLLRAGADEVRSGLAAH